MTNINNFSKSTKFIKTVTSILMGFRAEEMQDFEILKIAFYEINTNHDGNLSVREI